MLRDDVQNKILEALDAILEAVKIMRSPAVAKEVYGTPLSPPRRSWKRLAAETPSGGVWRVSEIDDEDKFPVTVIEGHIDLDAELREAWNRGRSEGERESKAIINSNEVARLAELRGEKYGYDNGYAEAMRMRDTTSPQPIAGVEPVVVEGFTTTAEDLVMDPWCIAVEEHGGPYFLAVRPQVGTVLKVPCTVAIWPGVVGGKRVESASAEVRDDQE